MTLVVFDLIRRDGEDLATRSYAKCRAELESLALEGPAWTTCETFDDGRALYSAVCELGFEA